MDETRRCDGAIEKCGIIVTSDPLLLKKLHMTGEHCKDDEEEDDMPRHKDIND
ncbi:MAG TPA: hypothetical protein VKM55_26455 [Candidatus Lokiarchaeia archaeon]|nr:hypothetical protein [Candidatus Lokiarchaeia archaeon]